MDELNKIVEFGGRRIEAIKVLFALAFNLNLFALEEKTIIYTPINTANSIISSNKFPFYYVEIGFKKYFLIIDKSMNIAIYDCDDDRSTPQMGSIRPPNNQIKIALFLCNHGFVPQLLQDQMQVG